jgi:hypothetical protein
MKLPRLGRERLLVSAAVACLALLLADRLVLTPLIQGWRERADELARLRAAIAQGDALVAEETRWLRQREEHAARMLPAASADAENAMLTHVNAGARETGLAVSSLRPRWTETPRRVPLLELQIAATGNLDAVVRFLHHLETGPLAIAVDAAELVPMRPDGSVISLDLRISGLSRGALATTRNRP